MTSITAIFARGRTIGSVLIRVLGAWGGRWSHVGILDETTNTVLEARYPAGVVETPLAEFLARYSEYELVQIDCPDPLRVIQFARDQLGKKYDWRAILGFIIKEPIARMHEWFCNELLEEALIQGGRTRFRVPSRLITTEQSYRVK